MLIDALVKKYGFKQGLTISGDSVKEWPYDEPIPSDAELKKLAEDHRLSVEYFYKRKGEYPPIVDQLDDLYHLGYDGWKAKIKIIKDQYPKPKR